MTPDLKRRILFTLSLLLVYRIGTFIPIPGVDGEVLQQFFDGTAGNIFGMVNLFSGGALERMSIFALNIMPYITASIIMQIVSSMHKGLAELKKEGEYGRAKVNQYTRYLTILLAFFQALGVYYALSNVDNNVFVTDSKILLYTTCVSLVGGTVILMWFGERITANGIGNGISLIIFVGIVSSLPSTFAQIFDLSRSGVYSGFAVIILLSVFILFILFISFVEKVHRKVKIQYPNAAMMRTSGMADSSFLPLKLNMAGVIPPIFASSVLMFPTAILQFAGGGEYADMLVTLFRRGGALYLLAFTALIVFFCYFYSSIVFNTKDVAANLKKSNCFILGIRPGDNTAKYLDSLIAKLTFIGAIYLCIVCVIPEIFVTKYSLPIYIGGTGLLIIVNVIMDLVNQFQSHLYSQKYDSSGKVSRSSRRRRVKMRG